MAEDALAAIREFSRVQDAGDYTKAVPLFAEDAVLEDPSTERFEAAQRSPASWQRW